MGVDELRERVLELRIEERELNAMRDGIAERLAANLEEQERLKKQLVTVARAKIGTASVAPGRSARATIARLGTFTMSEAVAELGWDKPRVRKLLDAMACEKPPAIVDAGKLGTTKMYRYEGPSVEEADPFEERQAAALEAVREWIVTQETTFTPAEVAAACKITRVDALRALRALQQLDVVADEGPTLDMPIFRRVDAEVPDVAIDRPNLTVVVPPPPKSKIPQIQELITAAEAAGCDVSSNGNGSGPTTFTVEALDGRRVHIAAIPQGRSKLLEDKAALRRIGVEV